MELFVNEYRETWIQYPQTAEDVDHILEHYRRLGFPGAVGSVDCTHIWYAMCPAGKHI